MSTSSPPSSSTVPPIFPACGGEPDLSRVSTVHEGDRVTLRNIIYTLWALNSKSDSIGNRLDFSPPTTYIGYNIRRIQAGGYLILAFFGPGYRISVQDMQLVSDVCPLRIDSIFVRGLQEDDAADLARMHEVAAAVLSISVLDGNQPVRITEAEIVRVRKRARGLLSFPSTLFGTRSGRKR